MQGTVARRRLADLDALAATVAQRFIDGVFVIVVIGILFIDFADDPSLQRILRAGLPCGKALFIRLACHIKVRWAELTIPALRKIVHRFDRRLAQHARSTAEIACGAARWIHLKYAALRRSPREHNSSTSDTREPDNPERSIDELAAG